MSASLAERRVIELPFSFVASIFGASKLLTVSKQLFKCYLKYGSVMVAVLKATTFEKALLSKGACV